MKTKYFGPKNLGCKSTWKKAGLGYEVAFTFKGKPLFLGNFVHKKEATEWYRLMNTEITEFSKKYTFGPDFPVSFFKKFIGNHLYVTYYSFLDKKISTYKAEYKKTLSEHKKDYTHIKREWTPSERSPFTKVA